MFIAAAETMVSVNGLAFAFSEAGPHMGSLLQATWALMQLGQLLTGAIALGNVAAYVDVVDPPRSCVCVCLCVYLCVAFGVRCPVSVLCLSACLRAHESM